MERLPSCKNCCCFQIKFCDAANTVVEICFQACDCCNSDKILFVVKTADTPCDASLVAGYPVQPAVTCLLDYGFSICQS